MDARIRQQLWAQQCKPGLEPVYSSLRRSVERHCRIDGNIAEHIFHCAGEQVRQSEGARRRERGRLVEIDQGHGEPHQHMVPSLTRVSNQHLYLTAIAAESTEST